MLAANVDILANNISVYAARCQNDQISNAMARLSDKLYRSGLTNLTELDKSLVRYYHAQKNIELPKKPRRTRAPNGTRKSTRA
jgi:hypothetical protein